MTVPYFRSNTGFSAASASALVSARTMSSWSTTASYLGGKATCITCAAKWPSFQAAAALRWEESAMASCSAREMWFSCAIFSALCPMVRPVEYSAMAGGTGTRSAACSPSKARSFSGSRLAREAFTSARASGRLVKIGASDMHSVPPAMATVESPRAIAEATSVSAWRLVAQARATVCVSMVRGRPAASTTSRAMLGASSVGMTWPKTSWSMVAGSTSERSTSSWTTTRPRSSAVSV